MYQQQFLGYFITPCTSKLLKQFFVNLFFHVVVDVRFIAY